MPNVPVTSARDTFNQIGACRVVATTNQTGTYYNGPTNSGVGATFTYANGVLTIDSVTSNLYDRILFAGQTLGYQNGIYIVTQLGTSGSPAILTRVGDFQCIEQMRLAHYTPIGAGTINAGSIWTIVEPAPAGVGVPAVSGANNINFANVAASGSGVFLSTANNLSELNNPTAQAAALENLGFHSAKAAGAGGSATVTITDARIVAASVVVASIQSSANAVTIQKVTPSAGTLTILLSADPGANVIAYHSTTAAE